MPNNDSDDLIDKIQKSLRMDEEEITVSKQMNDANANILSIKRKPAGEPQWYADDDGEIVVDWKEKFTREQAQIFPPFRLSEKVKVSGFVEADSSGVIEFTLMQMADMQIISLFRLSLNKIH